MSNLSYTEINITEIIKAWMNDKIDNKGIMLIGEDKSTLVLYASELDKDKRLRPFLRVKYKEACCPYSDVHEPIIDLPISIKIMSHSL